VRQGRELFESRPAQPIICMEIIKFGKYVKYLREMKKVFDSPAIICKGFGVLSKAAASANENKRLTGKKFLTVSVV
jgi:hypothetical protein